MTKKEIAIDFLQLAGLGKVPQAFENHISKNFTHHNQYFAGNRQALLEAMIDAHNTSPNKQIEIKQCFLDGENVITHSLVSKTDMDIAVVHIFRFEDNKIEELWDLGQIIDKNSPNKYGLF
jgi:predicted SnoaL-like aldol condensation-catalyzing enzyme